MYVNCGQYTHKHCTYSAAQHNHAPWRKVEARFAFHLCAPKRILLSGHMTHPWLSHLPFTTSTSSSSFTLPPATQEHAAQSVQQEQLREHFVDEKRYQRPVCYGQQQIGGNGRHTTPQVMSPRLSRRRSSRPEPILKILKNLSLKALSLTTSPRTDLHQLHGIQERYLEEDHQGPVTEEWRTLGKLATSSPMSNRRCISITTQRKAFQNQILKMESYEKC